MMGRLDRDQGTRVAIGRRRHAGVFGFTLLEIMVVVGLLGLVMAIGLPAMVRTVKKAPLHQSVQDVLDGLSQARAQAILQGVPARFVLRGDGTLSVSLLRRTADDSGIGPGEGANHPASASVASEPGGGFLATIDPEVAVRFIGVNLVEQMDAEEVQVVFHPNGTSDDFTLVLENASGVRAISLDPVTGFAETRFIR